MIPSDELKVKTKDTTRRRLTATWTKPANERPVKCILERVECGTQAAEEICGVLTTFNHPNIIRTYGCTVLQGNQVYFVLECWYGGDMTTFKDATCEQKIDVLSQVNDALSYLKRRFATHSNIVRQNIVLREAHEEGNEIGVALCGFADRFAKSDVQLTHDIRRAPEVTSGLAGECSDCWQFGMLAAEFVCARVMRALERHQEGEEVAFRFPPGVPETLQQLIIKCCSFDSSHRPSCDVIAAQLNVAKCEVGGDPVKVDEAKVELRRVKNEEATRDRRTAQKATVILLGRSASSHLQRRRLAVDVIRSWISVAGGCEDFRRAGFDEFLSGIEVFGQQLALLAAGELWNQNSKCLMAALYTCEVDVGLDCGNSPLHAATLHGNVDIVEVLLNLRMKLAQRRMSKLFAQAKSHIIAISDEFTERLRGMGSHNMTGMVSCHVGQPSVTSVMVVGGHSAGVLKFTSHQLQGSSTPQHK